MVGATMGRPKKKPDAKSGHEFKSIGIRCSTAWAEWLERGAKFCRTDIAKLVDVSVVRELKAQGFTEPPPDRIP